MMNYFLGLVNVVRETFSQNLEIPDTSRSVLSCHSWLEGTCLTSLIEKAPLSKKAKQAGGWSKEGSFIPSSQMSKSSCLGSTGLGKARKPALQLNKP